MLASFIPGPCDSFVETRDRIWAALEGFNRRLKPDGLAKSLFQDSYDKFKFSPQVADSLLSVALTIANLDRAGAIRRPHVSEALTLCSKVLFAERPHLDPASQLVTQPLAAAE